MVYVRNIDGQPLMPTKRYGKVRKLLKQHKAKIVKRCPFTIQLLYESTNHTQPISLGIDAGSEHIGVSATTSNQELFAAEVTLRTDIVRLLSDRREHRRNRRYRKTRYRKPRFNNRVHSKHKGWLAPSIQNKIDAHLKVVKQVCELLPVTTIYAETASFDIQRLKAEMEGLSKPSGKDYQEGEQLGFWNAREYVLYRDGHTCQCCHGKSKDKILNVHHIESRKTGGNAPNNLITLCKTCHEQYHKGLIELPKNIKRKATFKDATFMGIMRWFFYNQLKEQYPDVHMTYGYMTKYTRIQHGLQKSHMIDARCISKNPDAKPLQYYYQQKCIRSHNRKLHHCTILKKGHRKSNQLPKEIFGFRLFDTILYQNQECFIWGRRKSGYFKIKHLDGTQVHASVSYKKLKLLSHSSGILTERKYIVID